MKLIAITLLFFLPIFFDCYYDYKLGALKMKDNEVNVEDVEFKTREFIFEI